MQIFQFATKASLVRYVNTAELRRLNIKLVLIKNELFFAFHLFIAGIKRI